VPGTAARIARDDIEQRIADALGGGSLLVVAGAGFGKTTAIEAAVQRSGLTAAWVRCAEGDNDGTLMARVLGALRRAMPGAVDVLGERLVVPGQRVDPRALAPEVSGALAELLVEPLVLVLDDAEHAGPDAGACALLAELLAADGPIRVAVVTRTELPVHAARLEAAGRLTIIGPADLVFDARDCAELLRARRGAEPAAAEVDALLEATEGWPLGVATAALAGGAGLDGRAPAADGRAFAFLAEEVLDHLPVELTGRLEESALPAELDAVTLGALELPDGFVAEVRERGLFLGSAGAAAGAARYHPLFRALLLRRGEERRDSERRAALHARLAGALQAAGRPADSVEHWFAAGRSADAAGAIAAAGAVLTRTAPERVLAWLAQLPEADRRRPELALLEGATVSAGGNEPARAIALLRAAVAGFEAAGDAGGTWLARFVLADALIWSGVPQDVIALADDFEAPDAADLPTAPATALMATVALAQLGRIAEAQALAERVFTHPHGGSGLRAARGRASSCTCPPAGSTTRSQRSTTTCATSRARTR
jgi:ATP/maltotriose-dependent transcriptional regulator MalT